LTGRGRQAVQQKAQVRIGGVVQLLLVIELLEFGQVSSAIACAVYQGMR